MNKAWWLVIIVVVLGVAGFWGWRHLHEDHDHDHPDHRAQQVQEKKHKPHEDHDQDHPDHDKRQVQEEKHKPHEDHDHDHPDDHAGKAHEGKVEPPQPGEVRLTPEVIKQTGIETTPVLLGPLDMEVSFTGELVFNEERLARIRSRVPGRVVQIVADYGQAVKSGDVLAVIDSVELGKARMAARQAAARFNAAQKAYDRARLLYEGKAISQAELQERQARMEAERAGLDYAQNRLHLLGAVGAAPAPLPKGAKTSLPGSSGAILALRSPIAGRVVDRKITPGLVVKDEEELFTVADTSTLWCFVQIPEKDLPLVKEGSQATITVSSLSQEKFPGRVDYLADTVDKATRTVKGRVRVDNPQNRLKAGMFANIAIRAGERRALSVPESAVLIVNGEHFVFVEMTPGSFVKHIIKPGMKGGGRVEVLEGLDPDEPVVSKGAFILKSELEKGVSRGGFGVGHGHAH
jgi:cobalt-zinc-cadmium efflux system membrane fusion protein